MRKLVILRLLTRSPSCTLLLYIHYRTRPTVLIHFQTPRLTGPFPRAHRKQDMPSEEYHRLQKIKKLNRLLDRQHQRARTVTTKQFPIYITDSASPMVRDLSELNGMRPSTLHC